MQHSDPLAKAGTEPVYRLGGEGNLRHQYDGRAALGYGMGKSRMRSGKESRVYLPLPALR